MVVSLVIAIIASAVMAYSVDVLRLERSNMMRLQARYALDEAEARAALALISSKAEGPVRYSLTTGTLNIEAIAEPEAPKLGLEPAATLSDRQLARWGVVSAGRVREGLAALAASRGQTVDRIAAADASRQWALCARSAISPYGLASALPVASLGVLSPGASLSRVGQVWRVRVAASNGWVDDRVIRFTGSIQHPIDVASDAFGRGSPLGDACSTLSPASQRAKS